jgi:hypothetical protein
MDGVPPDILLRHPVAPLQFRCGRSGFIAARIAVWSFGTLHHAH